MGTGLSSATSAGRLLIAANVTAGGAALQSCGNRSATASAAELSPALRKAVTCQAPIT
jgi:hypothetical protein